MEEHELIDEIVKFVDRDFDAKELLSFHHTANEKVTRTLFSLLNDVFWSAINSAQGPYNEDIFDMRLSLHTIARKIDEKKHNEIFGDDWFEQFNAEYSEYERMNKEMPKIVNDSIMPIYEKWSVEILDYLSENEEKNITSSMIAKAFDWDLTLVRLVIEQMIRDKVLQTNKRNLI
jgi:hypothetical protein